MDRRCDKEKAQCPVKYVSGEVRMTKMCERCDGARRNGVIIAGSSDAAADDSRLADTEDKSLAILFGLFGLIRLFNDSL